METEADVIVVGAGICGIAAAKELLRVGLRVIVVEARDRYAMECARLTRSTGGRILSHSFGDSVCRVNLGANFIHGCDPDGGNLVYNLAREYNCTLADAGHQDDRYAQISSAFYSALVYGVCLSICNSLFERVL